MRARKRNFNIFDNYTYFTPDARGIVILLLWFLVGALVGNILAAIMMIFLGNVEDITFYAELIAYPAMFIPPMMYASLKSKENSFFGTGYKVSGGHYKPLGGWFCALLVIIGTLATSLLADLCTTVLPEPPQWLTDMLESLTSGDHLLLNFLMVSIMAPFFEEWLCRGMFLRGLLNCTRRDKEGNKVRGVKPVWAIVISAALFALIHLNPWQAIPAFLLGCLFGYVYYRTGSLKLTMLMHFTNNTFALILSNIPSLKDAESLSDTMSPWTFAALILFSAAFLYYMVSKFRQIPIQNGRGNCDEVLAEDPQPGQVN